MAPLPRAQCRSRIKGGDKPQRFAYARASYQRD